MKKHPAKAPSREEAAYPMRINKYLAQQGLSTRRGADVFIEKGEVFINGTRAILGDKVEEGDVVEVRSKRPTTQYTYVAYHKPRGIITHSAQDGEDDIRTIAKKHINLKGLFPIGRLDKDSHGLIILTNDGRITDRLLNPASEHEREYEVRTREKLRDSFKKYMEAGVDIEGYTTKSCKVAVTGEHSFRITLTEGKKHQIRRMVANLYNEVTDLKRIRIMNIRLENLPAGGYRKIEGTELEHFLTNLGLAG